MTRMAKYFVAVLCAVTKWRCYKCGITLENDGRIPDCPKCGAIMSHYI